MGCCAVSAGQGNHGGMMRCGGGVKEGGIVGAGGDDFYSMRTCTSIDDGGIRPRHGAPLPAFKLI
jgi:hypothetical protein